MQKWHHWNMWLFHTFINMHFQTGLEDLQDHTLFICSMMTRKLYLKNEIMEVMHNWHHWIVWEVSITLLYTFQIRPSKSTATQPTLQHAGMETGSLRKMCHHKIYQCRVPHPCKRLPMQGQYMMYPFSSLASPWWPTTRQKRRRRR